MRKVSFALLCIYASIHGQHEKKLIDRIRQQAKEPKEIITKEKLIEYNTARYEKYVPTFTSFYKPVYGLLENLYNALKRYSDEPLESQKLYSNITHFDSIINQLQQKDLTIAITRLLHYRLSNQHLNHHSNEMIVDLKKMIDNIEATIKKLASNQKLLVPFSDATPEKIAHITVADYFRHYVNRKFFTKVKKIRRAINNWNQKIY